MNLSKKEIENLNFKHKVAIRLFLAKPIMLLAYLMIVFAFIPAKYINYIPSRKRNILSNSDTSELSGTIAQFIGLQNFIIGFFTISLIFVWASLKDSKLLLLKKDLKELSKSEFSGIVLGITNKDRIIVLKGETNILNFSNSKMPTVMPGQKMIYEAYTYSKELIKIISISQEKFCTNCSMKNNIDSIRCNKCGILF